MTPPKISTLHQDRHQHSYFRTPPPRFSHYMSPIPFTTSYPFNTYFGVLNILIATVCTTSFTTFSVRTYILCYIGVSRKLMSSIRVFLLMSFSSRYLLLSLLKSKITLQPLTFFMKISSAAIFESLRRSPGVSVLSYLMMASPSINY